LKMADVWDQVAVAYERLVQPFTETFAPPLLDAVGPLVEHARLLDVAAGTGAVVREAVRRGVSRVVAADISPAMLQQLEAGMKENVTAGRVSCAVANGEALPRSWSETKFDVATSLFGLIFFENPRKGLLEMIRVLKPGGCIGIGAWGGAGETPAFAVIPAVMAELSQQRPSVATALEKLPKAAARISVQDVEALARDVGLEDVRVHGPLSHALEVPSAEAYWERFSLGAPGTRAVLAALEPNDAEDLRVAVLAKALALGGSTSDSGELSIRLEAAAYFVTATLPSPAASSAMPR